MTTINTCQKIIAFYASWQMFTSRNYKLSYLLPTFPIRFYKVVADNMTSLYINRGCCYLACSFLPLLLAAAAARASPHAGALTDLSLYGSDELSIPYPLTSLEKPSLDTLSLDTPSINTPSPDTPSPNTPSPDFLDQGTILESDCAPDNVKNAGKVRKRGSWCRATIDPDFQKTKPDQANPVEQKPAEQRQSDNEPDTEPDLGPLWVPVNGYEKQGPCSWPLRFLCCEDKLKAALGNLKDCWLCMCFFFALPSFLISQRQMQKASNNF